MKKALALWLAVMMLVTLLMGCGQSPVQQPNDDSASTPDVSTDVGDNTTTTTEQEAEDSTDESVDATEESTDETEESTTTTAVTTTTVKPTETNKTTTNKTTTAKTTTNKTTVADKTTTATTTKTSVTDKATKATTTKAPSNRTTVSTTKTTTKSTTKSTTKTTVKTTTQTTTKATTVVTTTTTTKPLSKAKLNGVSVSEYVVVCSEQASEYTIRAALYICDQILARTGAEVEMMVDTETDAPNKHEILVGETNRALSKTVTTPKSGMDFALMAKDGHVAMEADAFVIAAAAYYFIETYITGETASTEVPTEQTVCQPIVKTPKHFILLIGDGMGVQHTQLFKAFNASSVTDYSNGETAFYGYKFPYDGFARTNSLSGVTDSAAAGTALSTGYKTTNGRVGKDKDKNDLLLITELAGSMGLATGVMSTESPIGATPAAFSAHASSRDNSDTLYETQNALKQKYGTIVNCQFDFYNTYGLELLKEYIQKTLTKLDENEKGFFLMYEEAHIDKHSHSNNLEKTFKAVVRFNQAIALFMEYAFYHPDTFVLITADHETGGITRVGDVTFKYTSDAHTDADVPVFAYGVGGELFDDQTVENVQIPKTIAAMFGGSLAADTDNSFPPLNK